MKYPLAFITIPIILGVIFCYFIEVNLTILLSLLIASIIFCLLGIKLKYEISTGLVVMLFLIGMVLIDLRLTSSQLIQYLDKPIEIVADVEEVIDISENESKYIIRVHGVKQYNVHEKVSEKSVLNVIGNKTLSIGDTIRFNGTLREPLQNTNPHLYNQKLNLLSDRIFTICTIREYEIIELTRNPLDFITRFRIDVKEKVEKILDLHINDNSSSIMKSILLGDYSYLGEEEIQQFRDLGLAHVIAVSGLHIGILTSLLISLFAYIGVNRKINIVVSIIIIWIYAYIIGNPVSVLRANIMYTVLLSSQLFKKPYNSLNSLFFALLLLIIINPFWIFDIGFQLSFITTFFIICYGPKIKKILHFTNEGIFKSLSSIVVAQIGIFPILAYHFNRIPTIGIVANLLLIPLFNICLVMTIMLIPISVISEHIANSIGIIIDSIINIQSLGMNILSYFPVLYIKFRSPSIWEIILYYIVIFIIFDIIQFRSIWNRALKVILLFVIAYSLTHQVLATMDNSITVEFIDVGQGDSILIKSKEGNYLIDTGGNVFREFDVGKNILLPYLEKEGIFKLKGVFVTHFHEDHCKSLPYLMDNMNIENLYVSYVDDNNNLYRDIKDISVEKGIPIRVLSKRDLLKLDENTFVIVIGPDEQLLKAAWNEDNELSLVLLLKHFNNTILFTGDIERKGESHVIETLNRDIDLIKVPHHGSNTSSSLELLQKLRPKIAVVSVGRNNMFGHPHDEVIERYRENNISLYRTDESGLIRVYIGKDGFLMDTFIKEKPSIYHLIKTHYSHISFLIIYSIIIYVAMKFFIKADEELKRIELERIY